MSLSPTSGLVQPTLLLAGVVLVLQVVIDRPRLLKYSILVVGFFTGLWELFLALLGGARGTVDVPTLGLLVVSGAALFSKPTRNIRWAALLGLASGVAATYYFNMIIGHATPSALALVFLASTLLVYLLFKFAEDLLDTVGAILEIRLVSFLVGIICIIWALKMVTQ